MTRVASAAAWLQAQGLIAAASEADPSILLIDGQRELAEHTDAKICLAHGRRELQRRIGNLMYALSGRKRC